MQISSPICAHKLGRKWAALGKKVKTKRPKGPIEWGAKYSLYAGRFKLAPPGRVSTIDHTRPKESQAAPSSSEKSQEDLRSSKKFRADRKVPAKKLDRKWIVAKSGRSAWGQREGKEAKRRAGEPLEWAANRSAVAHERWPVCRACERSSLGLLRSSFAAGPSSFCLDSAERVAREPE